MPFVTDYVEYRRYETVGAKPVSVNEYFNAPALTREIESDLYGLTYMPHSIYMWVAPQDSTMYGSNQRVLLNNTYAQITACEVDYSNLSKIGNHYTEKDLYLMALRNGLEDRPYIDWVRADKCCYIRNAATEANANADTFVKEILIKTDGTELARYSALFLGLTFVLVANKL